MRIARPLATAGVVAALAVGYNASASAQNAAAGQQVFMKCMICHQIGPGAQDMIGPSLNGVVGSKAGSSPSYDYSDALKNSGLTWNVPTLTKWLKGPSALVPGTKMTFPGLTSDADIANVIAYLQQYGPDGQKK
jgi:cytochrome c